MTIKVLKNYRILISSKWTQFNLNNKKFKISKNKSKNFKINYKN